MKGPNSRSLKKTQCTRVPVGFLFPSACDCSTCSVISDVRLTSPGYFMGGQVNFAYVVFFLGQGLAQFWFFQFCSFLAPPGKPDSSSIWLLPTSSSGFQDSVLWCLLILSLNVFTDASALGWGVVTSAHKASQGCWLGPLHWAHSRVHEFAEVWQGLWRVCLPSGSILWLHSNWSLVVHCLNHSLTVFSSLALDSASSSGSGFSGSLISIPFL